MLYCNKASLNISVMKKILSLALVAMMATATVSAAAPLQDKGKKECCKKCDEKNKTCKGKKCDKQDCAKKCGE
jgi:hypothetical protein